MKTGLQDLVDTLEVISDEYENTLREDEPPTFEGFSKYLIEQCGITDKLQIVDKEKWTRFVLSRA